LALLGAGTEAAQCGPDGIGGAWAPGLSRPQAS